MIYNVAQLLKSSVGATLDVKLDPADRLELADDRVRLAGDIVGTVRLHRTNQGILADGSAAAPVELTCDRCLEPYITEVMFPLREQFYPTVDVVTGVELPAPDTDVAFGISQNHMLDLREALRQNLLLALPMQSLCRPDCAGLCPQCGRNRNTDPCDCAPERDDDRFAALRALLD
jgi:DUF177 domain-containing protein